MLTDNCYTYISSCACVRTRACECMRSTCEDLSNKKKKKGTWKNSLKLTSEKSEVLRFVLPAAHKKRKERKQLRLSFHHQMQQSTKLFLDLFYRLKFLQLPTYLQPWISSGLSWESKQRRQNLKMSKACGELCNCNNIPFFWREELSQSRKAENLKAKYVCEEWGLRR